MEKKLNIRGTQAVSRCNKKRTMSEGKFLISRLKVSSVLKSPEEQFPSGRTRARRWRMSIASSTRASMPSRSLTRR